MSKKEIEAQESVAEDLAEAGSVAEEPNPNVTDEVNPAGPESLDFFELLRDAGDTPVLIDFYADWCGPCKLLEPIMIQLAYLYNGRVIVAKVNIDENSSLVERYQIMSIPRVIIFRNGEPKVNIFGANMRNVYEAQLDALLTSPKPEDNFAVENEAVAKEIEDTTIAE